MPRELTGIAAAMDAIFMQFIPCSILIVLTIMLIYKLKESIRRRNKLRKQETNSGDDQTTNALLAIVILFLACEVPIACMLLASQFDHDIFHNVVLKTYHLAHLMRLLNASLNFILYCAMSSQFRSTFKEVYSEYTPSVIKPLFGLSGSSNIETPSGSKATDSMELSGQSKVNVKPGVAV